MIKKRPREGFFLRQNSMFNYLNDVRAEMKHVSWPTRRQAITYTIVVVIVSLSTAVYLGLLDYVFTTLVQRIV